MKRRIVKIHEDKCNGCGLCVSTCHEGAIELVDGKARLISDQYCDGLGDCLPACPTDAIEIVEREALPYDDDAVKELLKKKAEQKNEENLPCGCPGTMAKSIEKKGGQGVTTKETVKFEEKVESELRQWPVQIHLVNPGAQYLKGANLLIAADCTAFAYGNFHRDFIKNHVTIIGCPKLDDTEAYREKLSQILGNNQIKSITVVRMEVPCCSGIVRLIKEAMLKTETIVPYREVIIGIDGEIKA